MAKTELGTKRACTSCGAKFYDLEKRPVECPKCEATFMPDVLLPSKETAAADAKPAEAEAVEEKDDTEDTGDVEVISLDDVEGSDDDDAEDDEVAAIADVDLGDDDADSDNDEDDDTFLETDNEDDSDVTGLIGGVAGDEEDS